MLMDLVFEYVLCILNIIPCFLVSMCTGQKLPFCIVHCIKYMVLNSARQERPCLIHYHFPNIDSTGSLVHRRTELCMQVDGQQDG